MSDSEDQYRLGKSFIFPKEVMNDIHIKSDLGRYRMRGFSLFKKIPTWDDLTFMPGTLTRFVIEGYREKCLTKTIIGGKATGIHFLNFNKHIFQNLLYPNVYLSIFYFIFRKIIILNGKIKKQNEN